MRISDWSSDVCSSDRLAELFQDGADIRAHIAEIIRREHQADDITREVLFDVRRVFVTPFDRSAIIDLIGTMDDAIDQMNATGKSIELYELRSEEHTSELQSLMRISYAVFCLKKKTYAKHTST